MGYSRRSRQAPEAAASAPGRHSRHIVHAQATWPSRGMCYTAHTTAVSPNEDAAFSTRERAAFAFFRRGRRVHGDASSPSGRNGKIGRNRSGKNENPADRQVAALTRQQDRQKWQCPTAGGKGAPVRMPPAIADQLHHCRLPKRGNFGDAPRPLAPCKTRKSAETAISSVRHTAHRDIQNRRKRQDRQKSAR